MANETSFEKVMNACLEAKQTPSAKKAIKESAVKKTAKRTTASRTTTKKLSESKKAVRTRRKFTESDEDEMDDIPAVPDVDDIDYDDIGGDMDTDTGAMDDVADDIMVVVDPELDAEDIDSVASELQDIVDDTAEGEVPTTDEYVGDFTYACPICGTTFFSSDEMGDGDECPVCGNTPDGFVLVGQVASTTDGGEDDMAMDDFGDDEDFSIDDEDMGDEDLEADIDEEPVEGEDEEEPEEDKEESYRRAVARRRTAPRKAESRRPMPRKVASRRPTANRTPAKRNVAEQRRRPTARRATGYQLDESTFNPFMTRFIRENYKNAKSYRMVKATRYKDTNTLKIECIVTMKSGAKKKSVLKIEHFNPNSKVMMAKDISRTFKAESKTAPFRFTVRKVGNTIKCEGLRYNYITKSLKEGARLQVTGNLIRENRQPNRQPQRRQAQQRRRTVENRTANRRPASRRTSSNKPIHRI